MYFPGLASITVDTARGCSNAFAYVPDLTTYGLIVYSLRDNRSWRVTHNYFHLNPLAGNLRISGKLSSLNRCVTRNSVLARENLGLFGTKRFVSYKRLDYPPNLYLSLHLQVGCF